MQTINPFKHVRLRAPTIVRIYVSAFNYAEPDTVEELYDMSEEICDVSSEVADQLQRNAIGVSMRPFPPLKYQSRYDSDFLKFWQNTYKLTYPPPGCLKDLGKIEQLILDQATPLVQSSHPSIIGTSP